MEIKTELIFDDSSYDFDYHKFISYLSSCGKINKKITLNSLLHLMVLEVKSLENLDMNEGLINQKVLRMGALLSRYLFTTDKISKFKRNGNGRYLYNDLYSLDNIYPLVLNLFRSKCYYEFKLKIINLSNIQENDCKVSSTISKLKLSITSDPSKSFLSDLVVFKFDTEELTSTTSDSFEEDEILFEFLMNYYELLNSEDE